MCQFKFQELPPFTIEEFRPKSTKYCLIPIVYNEGDLFKKQLFRMSSRSHIADIIVAQRESEDDSTESKFLSAHGVRSLLTTPSAGGATAIRMAFWYALHQGYEGIILVDGHNKDGVEYLPHYIAKLEEGYDFVQGSRFLKGGIEKNTPLLRKIGIRMIMAPLLWIHGHFWYTDGTNGFRGYSKKFLKHNEVEPFRNCFTHFNLQYYLSYIAPKLCLKVIEIPVERVYPEDGTIPTKVTGIKNNFLAFWEMVRTASGKYDI